MHEAVENIEIHQDEGILNTTGLPSQVVEGESENNSPNLN